MPLTLPLGFERPLVLILLPLALAPLLLREPSRLASGWLAFAPRDPASTALGWLLRLAAAVAVAACVTALAAPHRPESAIERVGRGAEIVLLLDRSRSMDQGFAPKATAPPPGLGPLAIDHYFKQIPALRRETKGRVARRLLAEFAAGRGEDRLALVLFSSRPVRVLDFTPDADALQAAIAAADIGRGLDETNVALALEAAFERFEGRAYNGSRIVLLVSDGGDRLDSQTRERLARAAQRQRVSLYWLYLRSSSAATLADDAGDDMLQARPELALHRFFRSMGVPYRVYEAGDAQALEQAIADVDRLEKLPIAYTDRVPRQDLSAPLVAFALACALALAVARAAELERR